VTEEGAAMSEATSIRFLVMQEGGILLLLSLRSSLRSSPPLTSSSIAIPVETFNRPSSVV